MQAEYIQVKQLPESLQEGIISCVAPRSSRNGGGGGGSTERIRMYSMRRVSVSGLFGRNTQKWRGKEQAGNGKHGNSVVPPSPELADQRQMMLGPLGPKRPSRGVPPVL